MVIAVRILESSQGQLTEKVVSQCRLLIVHSGRDKGGLRVLLKLYFRHVWVISEQLYHSYLT